MDQPAPLTPVPGDPGPALHVDVAQRFASGFAVAAVLDAVLAPGSVLVLFGPSGAGKTTVLRQIAGLERPDAGVIRFGGEVWCDVASGHWRPPQERRVGLVFQQTTLFPHLTVADNISYGVRRGSDPVEEIAALLGIANLGNRYPGALSGGEAQRVALARALAPRPRLLLLDEPFAALDAPTRGRLRRDVRSLLQTTGTPAILVTHDRAEAMAMGDSVAVMIGGRVRQTGSLGDVFGRPADVEVAASLGIDNVLDARLVDASDGVVTITVQGVLLHAVERDVIPPGSVVFACIRAEDVTLETRAAGEASTRNHLAARIVAIASEGPIDRVTLDCGFPLDALITRRSRDELHLAPGMPVTAAIKATAVHVVTRF